MIEHEFLNDIKPDNIDEIQNMKKQLRKDLLKKRRSLSPNEVHTISLKICRKIIQSEYFKAAKTILIYNAMPDEVDLSTLTEAKGKIFVYPKCIENNNLMLLVPGTIDSWLTGPFGIMEPNPVTSTRLAIDDIDLVICPCSGFDIHANRLGMGGGYYDRLLVNCTCTVIAAAFEVQKLVHVPTLQHDRPMHAIFTENAVYTP